MTLLKNGDFSDNKIIDDVAKRQTMLLIATSRVVDYNKPYSLPGDVEPKSLMERWLDPKDRTVNSMVMQFAKDAFEGKGFIKTGFKHLLDKTDALFNETGKGSLKNIIQVGGARSYQLLGNEYNLRIRYSHAKSELLYLIQQKIIASDDKSDVALKSIIDENLEFQNPNSILNQILRKYQLKSKSDFSGSKYTPSYKYKYKANTSVFSPDSTNGYLREIKIIDGVRKVLKYNLDNPKFIEQQRENYKNAKNKDKFLNEFVNNSTMNLSINQVKNILNIRRGESKTLKNLKDGYLGIVKADDGQNMTEYSMGIEIDGKEMTVPTLIPGLNKEEIKEITSKTNPKDFSKSLIKKVTDHAKMRLEKNLPVWFVEEIDRQGP